MGGVLCKAVPTASAGDHQAVRFIAHVNDF